MQSVPARDGALVSVFEQSIGFLGAGRMATALARGCVRSHLTTAQQVLASDPSAPARQAFEEQIPGSRTFADSEAVLTDSDILILAVKPQVMPEVLAAIAPLLRPEQLVVSIAAGVTLSTLAAALGATVRLIRVMPNTPCLIGFGVSCYSRGRHASDEDAKRVQQILTSVGQSYEVQEQLLDAVTGLSGSGPAFVYRMIESLAAGGSQMGLPPELALQLAAQTARGAAEMVLTTGQSPTELREQVTSPGGTTLAGLTTLEQLQGAEAFAAAVVAATRRSQELGQG